MNIFLKTKQRYLSLASSNSSRYLYLILPLLFFAAMFLFFPFRERFEFDPDEGFGEMRALLITHGYTLYTEIWSDQPPLFAYMLATCIRIFGVDINAARVLVLLFSTSLLAVAAHILRITWRGLHAFAGVLLIFSLPYYTKLSVSAMVAIPIMTFAMISLLALLEWHHYHRDRWLILSGVILGFAVLTKLFIAFLAPIFIIGSIVDTRARLGRTARWLEVLYPAMLWCLAFGIVLSSLGLIMVGPNNLGQLLSDHLAATKNQAYLELINAQPIAYHMRDIWLILFLATLGCQFSWIERRWTTFYLVAWAAGAFIMLSFYAPIWYHYQVLISIPAAMLGGIAIGESLRLLPQFIRSPSVLLSQTALVAVFGLIGLGITLFTRLPLTLADFTRSPVLITGVAQDHWDEQIFLNKMANHAPETHWVVTTLPIYAFRLGLLVPPFIAVSSGKRIAGGELSEDQIIAIVNEYRPEEVLLREDEFPLLEERLNRDYRLLLSYRKKLLYLREDLKGQ